MLLSLATRSAAANWLALALPFYAVIYHQVLCTCKYVSSNICTCQHIFKGVRPSVISLQRRVNAESLSLRTIPLLILYTTALNSLHPAFHEPLLTYNFYTRSLHFNLSFLMASSIKGAYIKVLQIKVLQVQVLDIEDVRPLRDTGTPQAHRPNA